MSAVFGRGRTQISANLTPMIDVIFLLIIFFVLVSQIVKAERVELTLPEPKNALTAKPNEEHRAIINVKPDPVRRGEIAGYTIGANVFRPDPEGVGRLVDHLVRMYRADPELNVNLRADRSTHYEWVEPALHAVTVAAGRANVPGLVPRVNLVVLQSPERIPE